MHRLKIERIKKKATKAQGNFKSPYKALFHCIRSGTSRSLELEYLVERKRVVKQKMTIGWSALLLLAIIMMYYFNEFYLPHRCRNSATGKDIYCGNSDVEKADRLTVGSLLLYSNIDAEEVFGSSSTGKTAMEEAIRLLVG